MPTEELGNAPGDVLLSGTMPQAEYMYGCVATSVGMLLGYYDLYGYRSGDITYCMDDLIEGTISVCSRGSDDGSIYDMSDPSVLANFIASTDYVSRFYGTSSAAERPYTYVNGDPAQGLNISVWNCLADYLGTGQYWRGNGDLSTKHYTATLSWLKTTGQTYTVDAVSLPARYVDFKYGLSLYVEGRGYTLDAAKTQTLEVGGGFTFSMLKAEIDAGRPVLLSMRSADNHGHMVLAYGYNAGTQEVIFDDTYDTDCRMSWGGTYDYSSRDFHLTEATTVVFETDGLTILPIISGNSAINAGETMIGATVNSGGVLEVSSGGSANETTVNSGGYMDVYSGGSANNTTLNGDMYVYSGGSANNTTLNGYMEVYSGGTANYTTVNSGGWMRVYSGGTANETTVNSGGHMRVSSGGTALNVVWTPCVGQVRTEEDAVVTYVSNYVGVYFGANDKLLSSTETMTGRDIPDGYEMYVMNGGTANNTTLNGGLMYVYRGGTAHSTTANNYGSMYIADGGTANFTAVNSSGRVYVSSGGTANSTTVNADGFMYIYGSGTANFTAVNYDGLMSVRGGGTANDTTVNAGGHMYVSGSGTASNTAVNSGGYMSVDYGGTANATTVNSGGWMSISSGGSHCGSLQIAGGAVVSAYAGAIIDFAVAEHTADGGYLINDLSLITGAPTYTVTVSATQAAGRYTLADGASGFAGTFALGTGEETYGSITVNGDVLTHGAYSYTLTTAGSTLFLTVDRSVAPVSLTWDSTGATRYVVEFSTDDFAHALRTEVGTTALDSLNLPQGNYQWRVRASGNGAWATGEQIAVEAQETAPRVLQSDDDGNFDLFFARSYGRWGAGFDAQHVGTLGGGEGSGELVRLEGKNRIADIFEGSTDANLLVLTDDTCGDALFLDDLYSAFPAQQRARLAQIDEIRAGAGDDIVDLTSQRFEYANSGMTVRGGLGNDTVWANSGENRLFGDAGNDRLVGAAGNDTIVGGAGNDSMHGGGGDDTFTFGANWGTDTVEQRASGSVTLWFASGNESNWNADTLTYTDGANSVTVSGVTADRVTLKFGAEAGYDALASLGAFADASSEKIFEDTTKGLLA